MGYTPIYNLLYLDPYDASYPLDGDERRFAAMEAQLYGLYSLFGNGVIDDDPLNPSWRITPGTLSPAITVLITPGHGHVQWKAAATPAPATLSIPPPIGAVSAPVQYWLYAAPNETTADQMTVAFLASFTEILAPADTYVGLGGVVVDYSVSPPSVMIFNDAAHGRQNISLFSTLSSIINKHVHIGGARNPSQINLGPIQPHVRGVLDGAQYVNNLNLNQVTAGTLSQERLPLIPHSSLLNVGSLTHGQLEDIALSLLAPSGYRLSDLMTSNMLVLALALLRQSSSLSAGNALSTITKNLINAFLYIPGITDSKFEDGATTAIIDHVNHNVRGSVGNSIHNDGAKIWQTDADFAGIYSAVNTQVIGTGIPAVITLNRPVNYEKIAGSDLSAPAWKFGLFTSDGAALTTNPAKVTAPSPDALEDIYGAARYLYLPFSAAQDFSHQQKMGLKFAVGAGDNPGVISAFLILATGGASVTLRLTGAQSDTNISISNLSPVFTPGASPLASYVELNISDLTAAGNLTNVLGVGFTWSTAGGWDSREIDFTLLVPSLSDINDDRVTAQQETPSTSSIFIWNNTLVAPQGTAVFRFGQNGVPFQFNSVNSVWIAGLAGKYAVTTRSASAANLLASTPDYAVNLSTGAIDFHSTSGSWIDIRVALTASADLTSAPQLDTLALAYAAPGANVSKSWTGLVSSGNVLAWSNGSELSNLSVDSNGYLIISSAASIGAFTFLQGDASRMSGSGGESAFINDSGLYLTPYQAWGGAVKMGFQSPKDTLMLPGGNVIVADYLNDRVVEMTAAGEMLRAIQGNLRLKQINRDFAALTAIYNPRLYKMWIAFSQNVTIGDISKIIFLSGGEILSGGNSGISAALFSPINGNSSTLEIDIIPALALSTINGWTAAISVILSAGAVSSAGFSSDGNGIPVPVPTSPPAGSIGNAIPGYLAGLYNVVAPSGLAGVWQDFTGLAAPYDSAADNGDFNGDGLITATLLGPGGQSVNVTLPVFVGDVTWDNLYSPVSVTMRGALASGGAGTLVVASSGADCVTGYDSASVKLWSISIEVAAIPDGLQGGAYEASNGAVVIATPIPSGATQGQLLVVNRGAGNVVTSRLRVNGDAVYALPVAGNSGAFWVLVDDRLNGGINSRVLQINDAGKVLYAWGSGALIHPTGMRILANGNIVVSE